ncbi:hypothetical protein JCM21900_006869 [Sporobolomyces salmonicolor]
MLQLPGSYSCVWDEDAHRGRTTNPGQPSLDNERSPQEAERYILVDGAPEDVYTNADLDPTPPENRTRAYGSWFSFRVAASLDPAFWQTGASLIPLGLSIANSIGIVVLGNVVIAVPIILNGVVGARLRIPLPVAVRASMGYYFAVVSRFFLACIWFGVEIYDGGSAMTQFLRAIWPSYSDIANHMPESAGFTTKDISFGVTESLTPSSAGSLN